MLRKSFSAGLLLLTAAFVFMISTGVRAQSAPQAGSGGQLAGPVFHGYKDVTLGMTMDNVHQKLGVPKEATAAQDFYTPSDKEAVQIFYDRAQKVKAITVSYLGEGSGAPDCRAVLGQEIAPATDGSVYKLITYQNAGYWVSYNRTGGDDPLVTVTIQRIAP